MEKNEQNQENSMVKEYCYSICPICSQITSIKINKDNFTISYSCKNGHKKEDIFFINFSKNYLYKVNLESKNKSTSKSNKVPNNKKLNNKQDNSDINTPLFHSYISKEKTCKTHNFAKANYCLIYKENICIYCEKENNHENHNTKSYGTLLIIE